MRAAVVALVGALVASGTSAGAEETVPEEWVVLQVEAVRVETSRPDGGGSWDAEKKEGDKCGLAGEAAGVLLASTGWGLAVQGLCILSATTGQQERDPRAPDLLLRLSSQAAVDYFSPIVSDAYYHDFAYGFLVPIHAVPNTGIKLSVLDQDGKDPTSGELMGTVRLTADDLRALVKGSPAVKTLADGSLQKLEITAAAYKRPGSIRGQLHAKENATRTPWRVTAGETIEIRAAGKYVVSSWDADSIGPDGYVNGKKKEYNLSGDPFAKANHGSAIAIVGSRLNGFIVGSCRQILVPSSGGVALGINDRDPRNNSGDISFQVSTLPPSVDAWRRGSIVPTCSRATASRPPNGGAAAQPTGSSRVSFTDIEDLSGTTLDPDQVARIIRSRYLQGIKRCHERLLKQNPSAKGRVTLRFTVGPTGGVSKSSVKGFDSTLDGCIKDLTKHWRLAEPHDENGHPASADFQIPMVLEPG